MDIEIVASELAQLSKIGILSKGHLEQAKNLMKKLKKMGMSTQEISQITDGKWSESSIKGYVKGLKSPAEGPWQDAIGIFSSMAASGLHLSDIEMAVGLVQQLHGQNISLLDLAEFVAKAKGDGADPASLIKLQGEWNASGLDTATAKQALELWQNLHKMSWDLAALAKLAEAAGKYGQLGEVIDAITEFGNLSELHDKVQAAQKELGDMVAQRQSAEQVLKKIQGEAAEAKKPLTAYQEAVKLGFHHKALAALAEASKTYGSPEDVLKAINTFGSYANLVQKQKDAEAALSKTEVACANLEVKWAHLQAATDMCQKLIVERKFGLDSLQTLFSVVSKYGGLLDVLKAVESYATVEQLKKHIEQLKKDVKQVEGKLSGLTGSSIKAEAQLKTAIDQFQFVTAKALEVGAEIGKIEQEVAQNQWVMKLVKLVSEPTSAPYDDYGRLVGRVAKSLWSWVSANEKHLFNTYIIRDGLNKLADQLEGS